MNVIDGFRRIDNFRILEDFDRCDLWFSVLLVGLLYILELIGG